MTVHDDLAMLRLIAMKYGSEAVADRVEAEIARLTEQRDILYRANQKQIDLVRAAEAEVARLRDGLRRIEWIDRGEGYDECAFCEQSEASGHTDDCPLRALLAEGGAA